jgi:DNA repair photolyase
MSKLIKSTGNMYTWVNWMWSPLTGYCPHECSYCYAKKIAERWGNKFDKFRFNVDDPGWKNTKPGDFVFVCHTTDLFADGVEKEWIDAVLTSCFFAGSHYGIKFVFQTKNPRRIKYSIVKEMPALIKYIAYIGTTIETNRLNDVVSSCNAPVPSERALQMNQIMLPKFVTIEPVMDFDVNEMLSLVKLCRPQFVNIGADSKHCNLPEPSKETIGELILGLHAFEIHIERKSNLKRITG